MKVSELIERLSKNPLKVLRFDFLFMNGVGLNNAGLIDLNSEGDLATLKSIEAFASEVPDMIDIEIEDPLALWALWGRTYWDFNLTAWTAGKEELADAVIRFGKLHDIEFQLHEAEDIAYDVENVLLALPLFEFNFEFLLRSIEALGDNVDLSKEEVDRARDFIEEYFHHTLVGCQEYSRNHPEGCNEALLEEAFWTVEEFWESTRLQVFLASPNIERSRCGVTVRFKNIQIERIWVIDEALAKLLARKDIGNYVPRTDLFLIKDHVK